MIVLNTSKSILYIFQKIYPTQKLSFRYSQMIANLMYFPDSVEISLYLDHKQLRSNLFYAQSYNR